MTCVVFSRTRTGLYVAADGLVVDGGEIYSTEDEKFKVYGDEVVVGFSGECILSQDIIAHLDDAWEAGQSALDVTLEISHLFREGDYPTDSDGARKWEGEFLVADRGSMYNIEEHGEWLLVHRSDFAIGSGAAHAIGYLSGRDDRDLDILAGAVLCAAKYRTDVGGLVRSYHLL